MSFAKSIVGIWDMSMIQSLPNGYTTFKNNVGITLIQRPDVESKLILCCFNVKFLLGVSTEKET